MAERKLDTAHYWAGELQITAERMGKLLESFPHDGVRGKSLKTYYLTTVLSAIHADPKGLDASVQRARKDRAMADRLEFDERVRRGEFVHVAEAVRWYGTFCSNAVQALNDIPAALNQFGAPPVVTAECRRRIDGALRELSTGDSVDLSAEAGTDDQPVGGPEPKAVNGSKRRARTMEN